jgi:pyruvate dehydrogenase E1 component alpha subunit
VPEADVADADRRAADVVAAAVEAAKAAPPADPAEALTDVWADGGSSWRT